MWAQDKASRALGMAIAEIAPGAATLTMPVSETMVNGHGLCHGGYIFTLADSAFAFACNSHNQRAVAQTLRDHLSGARQARRSLDGALPRGVAGRALRHLRRDGDARRAAR